MPQGHLVSEARPLGSKSTTYSQSPNRGSSGEAKVSTQSQSFENVGTTADSSVYGNGDTSLGDRGDFTKDVESGGDSVELSTAMVGDDYAVKAVLDGELCILNGVN